MLHILVGRTMNNEGWTYDKIPIPTDVEFRKIQTAVKGTILMLSAPKNNSRFDGDEARVPNMFTATPNVSSISSLDFPDDGFGSLTGRGLTGRGLSNLDDRFRSAMTAQPDLTRSGQTYDVKKNDEKFFEAHVPLGPDFVNQPQAIDCTVRGNTVTINAKIEVVDSKGSKRMSRVSKDITLPAECNMKTMTPQLSGENMIISAQKNSGPTEAFVPLKDRQMNENKDLPWSAGNVTNRYSFLDDTLKELERNKQTIIDEPKNNRTEVHFGPGIRVEPTQPQRKKSTGKTVRFGDPPSTLRTDVKSPEKEAARDFLSSTLPSTGVPKTAPETVPSGFTIKVDHESPSPRGPRPDPTTTVPQPNKQKGVGTMDVDDFILAEVGEEKNQSGLNKLEDGMKKMHLELLQEEERPAKLLLNSDQSIPPDEPFEDLGCVDGSPKVEAKKTSQAKSEPIQAVKEEIIIPKKIDHDEQISSNKILSESPPTKVGRQESPKSIPVSHDFTPPSGLVTPDQFSSGRTSGQSIPVNFFPNVPAGQTWPAPPVGSQQSWPAPPSHTGQPQSVPMSPQMGPQANFMPFYYPPGWAEWAQQMQQQMAKGDFNSGESGSMPGYPGGFPGYPMFGMYGQPMPFPMPMMNQNQQRRGSDTSLQSSGSIEIPVEHYDDQGNIIRKTK